MKPAALSAILLLAAVPAAALSAQSCPGPDLSVPPDGATSVEVRHADVPSARFPGAWQQGRLGDLSYRLYPGGFGTIGEGAHMEAWRIEISCNAQDRTCTYWRFGEVPEDMQPRARQLGRCLLGPEPRKVPPAPAAGKAAPAPAEPKPAAAAPTLAASPAPAEPKALTREPAPASPNAPAGPSAPAHEAAAPPAEPRTLTREPAPAAPNAPAGPSAAARETSAPQAPADPAPEARETTPSREPALAAPNAAAPRPAPQEPALPTAEPRTPAREPAPASRESAPPLADPRPFLCWTIPEIGETGTRAESEVLVCRPVPASQQVLVEPAPAAPSPAREPAAPSPTPAPAPEGEPAAPRPSSTSDQPQRQPQPDPLPKPDPAPAGEAPDAARQQPESHATTSGNGATAAPESPWQASQDKPPALRAAGAVGAPPAAPIGTGERINLLPLSRPRRDQDRSQVSAPRAAPVARPAAWARPSVTVAPQVPPPRVAYRPQPSPPAATPQLALTRCALGSAAALGSEEIGDIGQVSVNINCSGRFGDRLTFSGGLTTYPIQGDRHGGHLTYSYALNWRITDKVTLTYANYTAALAGGRALAGLGEGRLQLSAPVARVPLGSPAMPDRVLACTGFVSMARSAPSNAGVNCGVNVTERLAVRFTALAYPPGRQRESDADFSYSASYALSDRVALTYSNYANNRWPWNPSPDQVDLLHGGTLGLSYRWDF